MALNIISKLKVKSVQKPLKPLANVLKNNVMIVAVLMIIFIMFNVPMPGVVNNIVNSNVGVIIVVLVLIALFVETKNNVIIVLGVLCLYELIVRAKNSWMYGSVIGVASSSQSAFKNTRRGLGRHEYAIEGFQHGGETPQLPLTAPSPAEEKGDIKKGEPLSYANYSMSGSSI